MQKLNLPSYKPQLKSKENKTLIFDKCRKKYVALTPEEWVRQHFINYLIEYKKYPFSLIAIEKELKLNNLKKRSDIIVFNKEGKPNIIVECKGPSIKINQSTFDQIARYNLEINAQYLIVTNGLEHYYSTINHKNKSYTFLKDIPNYNIIL